MYNEINKQSVGNSNALFVEAYMIIDLTIVALTEVCPTSGHARNSVLPFFLWRRLAEQ